MVSIQDTSDLLYNKVNNMSLQIRCNLKRICASKVHGDISTTLTYNSIDDNFLLLIGGKNLKFT